MGLWRLVECQVVSAAAEIDDLKKLFAVGGLML